MADAIAGGTTVLNDQTDDQPVPGSSIGSSDDHSRLADLVAQATSKYAVKDYNAAAELYAHATELQASINGEMAVENADLLFSYGKALFHVAVSKSDVLGTKAAGDKVGNAPAATNGGSTAGKEATSAHPASGDSAPSRMAEEVVAALADEKEIASKDTKSAAPQKQEGTTGDKPLFHFTGDENWDDSDEEEQPGGEEADEEEDDFATAFEVLDLARVLFNKKLDRLQQDVLENEQKGKQKETQSAASSIGQVKNQLADVHDFQAEISFEGEKWPNAASDLKASLELKTGLYPQESNILAECHYKLSLALEFASVTQQRDESGNIKENIPAIVDEKMRQEAAQEMELAIDSCILRVSKETSDLVASGATLSDDETQKKRAEIDDVKEMVKDMQQRLEDLRKPPVSINDPTSTGDPNGATPLNGILGQILGESKEEQSKRLAEANAQAKDISGLVKKKPAKSPAAETSKASKDASIEVDGASINGNGKRKAEELTDDLSSKKTRVEEAN